MVIAYLQKENQNYSLVALANVYFLILQHLNLTNFKNEVITLNLENKFLNMQNDNKVGLTEDIN